LLTANILFRHLDNDVLFEFLYDFPGFPPVTRGRDNLTSLYSGRGNNVRPDLGDSLIVPPSDNGRVVTLECSWEDIGRRSAL
jgi:hypothetical protein